MAPKTTIPITTVIQRINIWRSYAASLIVVTPTGIFSSHSADAGAGVIDNNKTINFRIKFLVNLANILTKY